QKPKSSSALNYEKPHSIERTGNITTHRHKINVRRTPGMRFHGSSSDRSTGSDIGAARQWGRAGAAHHAWVEHRCRSGWTDRQLPVANRHKFNLQHGRRLRIPEHDL